MADWDEDSPQLRTNLVRVLSAIRRDAAQRKKLTAAAARRWQIDIMHQLTPKGPQYVGRFRGEPGLEHCQVRVGRRPGVPASKVAAELQAFEDKLQQVVTRLDKLVPPGGGMNEDVLAAVIDTCAWAHAEWVRIHPFANGNGRTARLWANAIAMRYDLPPFVRLRPRPDGGYGDAAGAAMEGRWQETVPVFQQMLREAITP